MSLQRRLTALTTLTLASILTALPSASGCGSEDPGAASADAGTTGPGACVTLSEPSKDLSGCLDDDFGVYVSPSGSDGDPGTRQKPFQT